MFSKLSRFLHNFKIEDNQICIQTFKSENCEAQNPKRLTEVDYKTQ